MVATSWRVRVRGRWCNGADAMVLRGQKWTGDIVADTPGSPGIIASVAGEPTGLLATTPAMRPEGRMGMAAVSVGTLWGRLLR